MMLFNIKKLSAEQLQKGNEELYNAIFQLGVVEGAKKKEEETKVLEEKKSKDEVLVFAAEKGLTKEAEELFAKGQNAEQVAEELNKKVEAAAAETQAKNLATFEQSAPLAAGAVSSSELEVDVKTWEDAVKFVQKRDGCTKAQAVRKASVEFAEIHRTTFNTHPKNK